MQDQSIQQVSPNNTALNAEHYQSFEMAKANDGVIGGDDIAQIRSYSAFARAQAQAVHKSIASMSEIEDVAATKAEMTETAQTFAKVSVYADQRIGEILRELPKSNKWASNSDTQEVETKAEAIKESGISNSQAYDLQAMAANPEVVEAVIAKAEQDGRVVSRSQVLKAINERKRAERELQEAAVVQTNLEMEAESLRQQLAEREKTEEEYRTLKVQRDSAIESFEELATDNESLQHEIAELEAKLEKQADEAFEEGFKAAEEQQRYESARVKEVVREVVPEEVKRRIESLEYDAQVHADTDQKLRRQLAETRKKLDRAKVLLKEKGYEDNASWDISTLTSAINQLLRTYGGKVWAFDQFYCVDEVTQQEFVKAITNLAAFSQSIVQYISDNNKLEV